MNINQLMQGYTGFTRDEVARMAACSHEFLIDCQNEGIVNPTFQTSRAARSWEYTLREVLMVRVVVSMRNAGVEFTAIKQLVGELKTCRLQDLDEQHYGIVHGSQVTLIGLGAFGDHSFILAAGKSPVILVPVGRLLMEVKGIAAVLRQ